MSFLDDYSAYTARHGTPDRIELLLPDLNGVFRGKWLPGDQADKLARGQVRLPYSTCAAAIDGHEIAQTGLGIVVGDPDGVLRPVPGTLAPAPWAAQPTAQVLVDMDAPDGQRSGLSPRRLLHSVLDRYAARGWTPIVAPELEFYILRSRASADAAPQPLAHTPPAQNYNMDALARSAPWLEALDRTCQAQALPCGTITAEYGPGQFEVNLRHGPAMAAADQATLFRRAVRHTLDTAGAAATFMAKPYAEAPGNGFHLHVSVLGRDGRNIFDAAGASGTPGPHLSAAVAGTLATMRDLQVIFAPHLNSYRRFGPLGFAPASPDWGFDDRRVAVRVAETTGPAARLEHRIAGADANPYLVITAILGGILHGIEQGLTLPAPMTAEAQADPLCPHWSSALDTFAASDIAHDLFGAAFVKVFTAMKRAEISALTTPIPPHEYAAYL